jgi:adenylate cyclase class 2
MYQKDAGDLVQENVSYISRAKPALRFFQSAPMCGKNYGSPHERAKKDNPGKDKEECGRHVIMQMGNSLEIEVKFYLTDPPAAKHRLMDLGELIHPEVFETNIRYEDSRQNLIREGKLLRLRRDNTCRLTFKSRTPEQDDEFKIYRELEVTVDNYETMNAILVELGYKPAQIYEKRRETFAYAKTTICIDTMPYGVFLEIEGTKSGIKETVRCLGLDWQHRIIHNYLKIFDLIKIREGFAFNDVTFANFKHLSVDLIRYLPMLYANPTGSGSAR